VKFQQTFLDNPEDLPHKWIEAWNKRDAVALANLFTKDAEFVNVVGLWWHSREAIWKAHDYGLKVIFNKSDLSIRKVTTKYVVDEVAIVYARMKLSGQSEHKADKDPGDRKNIFSFILKKESKGWVCVSAHNTDVVPGKETNIIGEDGKMRSVDYRKR